MLVIFAIFAVLIFDSFTSVLISAEKSHVNDTIKVVENRLGNFNTNLDVDSVTPILRPEANGDNVGKNPMENSSSHLKNIYDNSIFISLSRDSTAVSVYDQDGAEIFASRPNAIKFDRTSKQSVKRIKEGKFNGFVGVSPICAHKSHKIIGYVQVTNELSNYHATTRQLATILLVLGLIAVFASTVLSYILAYYQLRPIDEISETINEINVEPQSTKRVPNLNRNDELSDLADLFNDMLDRMQRYIEQQQQFVEDVSHELRTPVAVIQGHMELLNRWGKDDPEVLDESLKASLQETQRMQSLVQEMLDLSRAEQVEINYNNQVTEVKELVNRVFNDFKMIHPDFTFTLDDDVRRETYVQIYRNHLEQVLIILLDNAVKYSVNRKEIHMSFALGSRSVEIAVQDFGEGISQDNMARVFNRFYRVDKARSRNKGGNGLGLSIAQRLIESYHGQISIESAEGHGSVFRITLPILTPEKRAKLEKLAAEDNKAMHHHSLETNLGANPTSEGKTTDSDSEPK
ncbi:signal transduction histidine kinase [Secundilactobacillus oryzae JCM 18671]|uniref:Signal transduction histidine-protein kinase ArlS n=1 Tax=Secundilactobacillus oryzae JCM 18671 TaxID=1291743 RepID=A0A081BG07_9LACO|nr:signal transduction histidine kinase [Secundilactobacillus oryzae JCM 18671]